MKKVKQTILLATGAIFVLLGIIGLVLPFLQGILFIIIGIFLLSFFSPRLRLFIDKHTCKCPILHSKIKKVQEKITKIFGEI